MKPIEARAPAKVNLALHVTGIRADGYHLLDSIVAFADFGDRLQVAPGAGLTLDVTGPQAGGVPAGRQNSVLQAAALFGPGRGAVIGLEKHLPHAAGLGGGSADAAAALRALSRLWSLPLPDAKEVLALGADVPVCLVGTAARMRGIGEELQPIKLPAMPAVLVNPQEPLATHRVFAALGRADNPPMGALPEGADASGWREWLARCRNDLEAPACALSPVIGTVLERLAATPGAGPVRMSGSGATCFALYDSPAEAERAAADLQAEHPHWWCRAVRLG